MKTKPNIIFILADDMGYGDLSCYGAEKIQTPNIDRIAANGIKFTDAHSTSSVCTPSRYGILTGRYCWRSVLPKGVIGGFGGPVINEGRATIASYLKQNGYATAAFGKWHLGFKWITKEGNYVIDEQHSYALSIHDGFDIDYSQPLRGGPVDHGFDYFFGISGSLDMPPYCYIENDHTAGIPSKEKETYYNQQRKGMQAEDFKDEEVDINFARKAVEFIERHVTDNPEQPFFAYVPTASPHRPCDIQPGFVKGKSNAGDRGDMVILFDYVVGKITDTIDRLGIKDNTIIVVTSDNGARATCANGEDYGHKSNGNLRGQKSDIWDGGHREPLVIQWPDKIKAGSVCNELVSLADFFKTFAEITGSELPQDAGEDSLSILPYLLSQNPNIPIREFVIHQSGSGMFALRNKEWKLVDGLGSGGFTPPREEEPEEGGPIGQLYNMKEDVLETNNLWKERADIVFSLRKKLYEITSYYNR